MNNTNSVSQASEIEINEDLKECENHTYLVTTTFSKARLDNEMDKASACIWQTLQKTSEEWSCVYPIQMQSLSNNYRWSTLIYSAKSSQVKKVHAYMMNSIK